MLQKKSFNVLAVSAILVIGFIGGLIAYEQTRTLPEGVVFADLPLSGLNREQASEEIDKHLNEYREKEITITGRNEQSIRFSPQDLGIEYDTTQTTKNIFDEYVWVVRPFASLADQPESSTGTPVIHVNADLMQKRVAEFLQAFAKDPVNSTTAWEERNWKIIPEELGYELKTEEVARISELIVASTENTDSIGIVAEFDTLHPERTAEDMQEMLLAIQAAVQQPIEWKYGYDTITIDLADAPGWFEMDQDERVFQLDRNFAAEQIRQLAYEYDREQGQVVLTGTEEVISEYDQQNYQKAVYEGSFHKGRTVDQEVWIDELEQLIQDPSLERKKELVYQTLEPTITSLVPGLEFPQILSTGVSNYRLGSHPNRVQNIKLSLEALNGVIVQPGEEVSFNRLTGWITLGKGYTKTKIISEGRVEEGVGGGVCQSSTTAYRAILNAGFPVTERRNHTLDISYYHAYGYGLDATVYTDARSDLRFINDFPGPILIHTYTVDDHYDAYVEIYGTTDGRYVQLTNQPTGNYLFKQWEWKVVWPDREDIRYVKSVYQLPKEEEEEEANPLEA